MTLIPTTEYLDRFREALVLEIKAEMGRRDLSMRGLSVLLKENHQYVSWRLGAGNPKTKKRVDLTAPDLVVIASALNLDPQQLLDRAFAVTGPIAFMTLPDKAAGVAATEADLASGRDSAPLRHIRAGRAAAAQPAGADELETRRASKRPHPSSFESSDEVARTEDTEKPRQD